MVGSAFGQEMVYVNTVGPRFETRAEIRSYRGIGHVVGMTAGHEWMLCEELQAGRGPLQSLFPGLLGAF